MEIITPTKTTILIHCDVDSPHTAPLMASPLTSSNTNLTTLYDSKYVY